MRSGSASRSRYPRRRASGTGDLLDLIVELGPDHDPEPRPDDPIRLAVIGRPNVGKSSLVNRFIAAPGAGDGGDRVIVSDIAGTTRDAIDLADHLR